ncbi:uncharacterized protein LOC110908927 isoform X2 [Helianthus annuus]|uniref:uncharacterized protein LOC110908927 isoform X2 n=1 Tax=Helianthus annuus TaxID=4232 RepID=UPI0016532939|nr:uncharacterized protein LOC110908927 isoform X2 [Helianthus annuus]
MGDQSIVDESQNPLHIRTVASTNKAMTTDVSSHRMDLYVVSSPRKLVQCRICHDDDQDSSMEMPCGCRGSLKYAHRKCVQRWCNEKGNTTCEICLQPFKPGYTSPPQLFHYGSVPMNFRISSMVDTSYDSLEFDFDEYTAPSSTSLFCCRIVSIFFITLLVLRYTLPIIIKLTGAYSSTVLMLNLLMVIGILLPICIMARAFTAAQHLHRHQQQPDLSQTESQPNLIHVH